MAATVGSHSSDSRRCLGSSFALSQVLAAGHPSLRINLMGFHSCSSPIVPPTGWDSKNMELGAAGIVVLSSSDSLLRAVKEYPLAYDSR